METVILHVLVHVVVDVKIAAIRRVNLGAQESARQRVTMDVMAHAKQDVPIIAKQDVMQLVLAHV